jgi:hypothetical protein
MDPLPMARATLYMLLLAAYTMAGLFYLRTGCYALGYFDVTYSYGWFTWTSTGEPFGDPPTTLRFPSPIWLVATIACGEAAWAMGSRRIPVTGDKLKRP